MSALVINVCNARRQPLADRMDVHVVSARTDTTVAVARDVAGTTSVRIADITVGQPYIVKVFPMRHRAVSQFVLPTSDETAVQLFAPIDPDRVTAARFPEYAALATELRAVLGRSTVEGVNGSGDAIYSALSETQKAGLFNLFAKMSSFGFDEQRTVWSFVDRVYRIRADRIFVDAQPALRDLVKGAVASERCREVSGSLHTPPPAFCHAGSFKTADRYGNLQLTFFATQTEPLAFKVDADIDDAAGLAHTFQVIRNFATHGTTHPYDIHEILVFRQEVVLPYELA